MIGGVRGTVYQHGMMNWTYTPPLAITFVAYIIYVSLPTLAGDVVCNSQQVHKAHAHSATDAQVYRVQREFGGVSLTIHGNMVSGEIGDKV